MIFRILFFCPLLVLALTCPIFSQQAKPPSGTPPTDLMLEKDANLKDKLKQLRDQRTTIAGASDLEESLQKAALKHLDAAIQNLEAAEAAHRQKTELVKIIKYAPQRRQKIQVQLAKTLPDNAVLRKAIDKASLKDAERQMGEVEAALTGARAEHGKWEKRLQQQRGIIETLPKKIAEAKSRLKDIEGQLAAFPSEKADSLLGEATKEDLQSEKLRTGAEISLYERQLSTHETLVSLYMSELDLAAREIALQNNQFIIWRTRVQTLRRETAAKALLDAQKAKEKTSEQAPVIEAQYDLNIQLGRRLEQLTLEETRLQENLDQKKQLLSELKDDISLAHKRLEETDITETIGLALREQRQSLPTPETYESGAAKVRMRINEIQDARAEIDRMHRKLLNVEPLVQEIVDSVGYTSSRQKEQTTSEARKLLLKRREIVDRLQNTYMRIIKILRNIGYTEQQILMTSEAFADFLDRHLLWLRSSKPLGLQDTVDACLDLFRILGAPYRWKQTFEVVQQSVKRNLSHWILGLMGAVLLLAGRRWAVNKQFAISQRISNRDRDSLALSLQALGLNLYLSMVWPLLVGFAALEIQRVAETHTFPMGIGNGLMKSAMHLAGFLFLYHFSRIGGPAAVHFQWPDAVRATFHRSLTFFVPLIIMASGLIAVLDTVEQNDGASLIQLISLLQNLVAALYLGVMLRFSGGITSELIHHHPKSWLTRLRYIWYPVAVGIYLLVAVLVGVGYYYSAAEIRNLLQHTTGLALLTIILYGLAIRALTLGHRNLVRHRKDTDPTTEIDTVDTILTKPEDIEDRESQTDHAAGETPAITAISQQARSLLNAFTVIGVLIGLWLIWAPALPALQILHDVHLWTYTVETGGVTKAASFTLAGLILTILILIATFVAYRNLPGLLEIILLNHLPLDPGLRYAFSTVSRYTIAGVGVIVVFQTIGIRWSSIQWLIAALGVGLGFGLQETVANFISGLIVLFERPFRINDTVTIGDITGTVTRIRIRATTIRDWDRKELIVPNKEFITGRLINWSLSDNIIRLKFPVGIAYGSDTDLAEKLLLNAARESSRVLKDPRPNAVFLGFGDNSLNFELRAYIGDINDMIAVIHNVNRKIDKKFREAGISISFPQRDVHLDFTQGPVEVKLMEERKAGTSENE
ncbi:MAG: mechanosensitive ion channel [Deltaproteobacteria bacterium]|nr:mechanosensitive ion channel [Deltaproteobacteria bacterium]